MIIKFLLQIVGLILGVIIKAISSLTPEFTATEQLNEVLPQFINIFNQAKNFCYFIIGDAFYAIVDAIVLLIAFKIVIKPALKLLIKVLPVVGSGAGSGGD